MLSAPPLSSVLVTAPQACTNCATETPEAESEGASGLLVPAISGAMLLAAWLAERNDFQREAVKTYAQESPPLKAIGARYGVSREWVNQTRKRVVSDLRAALRVDLP